MQSQSIDARSTCEDFNNRMRDQGVIGNYTNSYAKDHDYQHHGFCFIQTESDVDKFLAELDAAPKWHHMGGESCTKAWRIRNSLNKPNEFNLSKVERFKMYASFARRTCCACHETGSFKTNTN